MYLISFFILVFLLGGIPFGLLISRYWLKIDIRQQGSGNIGMTNVMRVGGKLPGLLTFVLDFGKGSVAVLLAKTFIPALVIDIETQKIIFSLAGVIVVCGHVFSVFLRFKGGKGISTLFQNGLVLITREMFGIEDSPLMSIPRKGIHFLIHPSGILKVEPPTNIRNCCRGVFFLECIPDEFTLNQAIRLPPEKSFFCVTFMPPICNNAMFDWLNAGKYRRLHGARNTRQGRIKS